METFPKEEAIKFLAEYFYGEHHIPEPIKEAGYGWKVSSKFIPLATYDGNGLTRLVKLAHKYAIRAEITSNGLQGLTLMIHKRLPGGKQGISKGHDTIEELIEYLNK